MYSVERIYLRQRSFDASKLRVAASTLKSTWRLPSCTSTCMWFSRRNKIPRCRVAMHTLWEKGIRFRRPDYEPDRAQKLISSSMSRHLSTRNINSFSSKSMHAFLSNLANRQTDKRTRAHRRKHIPTPLSEVNHTLNAFKRSIVPIDFSLFLKCLTD